MLSGSEMHPGAVRRNEYAATVCPVTGQSVSLSINKSGTAVSFYCLCQIDRGIFLEVSMFERYKEDIQCFMEHDPAARSPIEIVLLYLVLRPCAVTARRSGS